MEWIDANGYRIDVAFLDYFPNRPS